MLILHVNIQKQKKWKNDKLLLQDFPNISKFVDAFEKRPNIKEYLASLPHKNATLEQELLQK